MADPQKVDALLGSGAYSEWQDMEREFDVEIKRHDRIAPQVTFSPRLTSRSSDDLYLLGDIAATYRQGLDLVGGSRPPDARKLKMARDLYVNALAIAQFDNDIFEALWGTGFAAAWVTFPFMLLQAKANLMLEQLKLLREALAEAERELKNAHNKRAFHLAVTFFEGMFPELSLTTRALIYLGDVVVDKALGPSNPTTAQRYAGDVTPGVKQFSEAVHHIDQYSHTAREVAEHTGKIATAATFYFDFKEISEGNELVEKLEQLVETVKRNYDDLHDVIEKNRGMLEQFLRTLDRVVRRIDEIAQTRGDSRSNLEELMASYGYARGGGVAWLGRP